MTDHAGEQDAPLPCPFCGSRVLVFYGENAYANGKWGRIHCQTCGADGASPDEDATEEEAIAEWNRRASAPPPERAAPDEANLLVAAESLISHVYAHNKPTQEWIDAATRWLELYRNQRAAPPRAEHGER